MIPASTPPDTTFDRRALLASTIAITLCWLLFVVSFYPLLFNSFWVDESITHWITNDSFDQVISRTRRFQASSSTYFVIIWLVRRVFGGSELALRMPSLIATLFLLSSVFNLSRREAGWLASVAGLLVLSSLSPIQEELYARPYAFTILLSFICVRSLLTQTVGEQRFEIRCIATVIALILAVFYLHYIAGGVLALTILALLILVPELRFNLFVTPWRVILVSVFVALTAAIPGLQHLLEISAKARELSHLELPSAATVVSLLSPAPAFVLVGVAALLATIYQGVPVRSNKHPLPSRKFLRAICISVALPVASIFLLSHVTGTSVFHDRYLSSIFPFLALLYGAALAHSLTRCPLWWSVVLLGYIAYYNLTKQWIPFDWRMAVARTDQVIRENGHTTVLVYSGLIELESPSLLNDETAHDYLNAPLSPYPVSAPTFPIPSHLESPSLRSYFETKIKPELDRSSTLILLSAISAVRNPGADSYYVFQYYAHILRERYGWQVKQQGSFGGVSVMVLRPLGDSKFRASKFE